MKRKTMAERKAEAEQIYISRHNKKILKKAAEINKILSDKRVVDVIFNYTEDQFTVTFKNRQGFKFKVFFPCVFHDRKIVPMLKE